ncbi:PREDICTED: uncharacterized protein LOC109209226 [Nicotiana attenuata]|uniref:uncharacterized protein LOC109209226 n=1 Tax=Nicotiana attenuata TaxID=49451 RepID=UPI000905B1DA|nr:PREDICTED: uncharacterized protein LOC109209226 [Nicotiana attenuata]
MGKSIELGRILQKRKINIACVQKTRWVGNNARDVNGYKLWYSGRSRGKNGVGILVDKDLRELVVDVNRVNDRLMVIKLVVGGLTLSVISTYTLQAGLDEEVKRLFWQDLDEVVRGILHTEKLFIGCDFNGHIGKTAWGVTSYFQKKEDHLVTFRSMVAKTQIDYLLYRKRDRGLCTDRKVLPGEWL